MPNFVDENYSFASREATCFRICFSVDSSVSGSVVCVAFVNPFNPAFCIMVG
nr:MAG TPA: hypothetical protein [Caudoviricetes sp.]